MKKLPLQNPSYRVLLTNFKQWLDILGYAETTVYGLPNYLQEFFYWLETNYINTINAVTTQNVTDYYQQLQERANQRQGGGLSKSYLNKHQQALKKLREYLKAHQHKGINIHLKSESNPVEERVNILTQSEIKELFLATAYSSERECIRYRDKAMLAVLYSCGLRRNEAVHLNLSDVYFEKQRIYVRKGKNYKKRFIPINSYNLRILEDYIYEARPEFEKDNNPSEALFLNSSGNRLQGMSFANRLKAMVIATENPFIIEKKITLHTLRHSIATHLLEQEVPLESIKNFLGHTSLESTQIYTHLLKTKTDDNGYL